MFSLQIIHIAQTGLKYMFDIDPDLTEHIFRHSMLQASALSQSATSVLRMLGDKFADVVLPAAQELRSMRVVAGEL